MKNRILLALITLGMALIPLQLTLADVVRPAPKITWGSGNTVGTLQNLKGQPVVVVVAKSPRDSKFRKQTREIKETYSQFAARSVVFIAVFTESYDPAQLKSDVPFVVANNGPETAAKFGISAPFSVAVIGKDGNIDLQSPKIAPAHRLREIIINSFEVQSAERRL